MENKKEVQKTAAEQEKEILLFWKKNKIYEKSRKKNEKGKKFYMMDGPPYATGHIHMGTALNKVLKDIAMRSQRLQGRNVFDRAGYDTHGVPIEFKIEKEIGSKSKQDIEKFGVKKFIDKCKEFATQYIDVMNSEFENLGVWMNFENPYLTLSDDYVETIWDTFKVADKKKLLYLGKYPVHICPRCETAVAFNEIVYAKQKDISVFVKFPLKEKKNTYLIIWTTTPWTLPGNTGVMANPDVVYQELELSNGEKWILAKDLIPKVMGQLELGFTVKNEFKGKKMEGWKYENPLAKNLKLKIKKGYEVVLSSRYVTTEDGTGLVHCAPGHGKEDYEVGKEYNLDMPSPVDINGLLTNESGKYKGKRAREVDAEIIEDLEKIGVLVWKMGYEHDYPLCWRCASPLLMVSQPQWFLKISDIQEKLLNENEKTNWIPAWMKSRMQAWLEGISDWPVSRMRYWGTPLPIWICSKCNEKLVIGSICELKKSANLPEKTKISVHKPEIDEIKIPCKCGGEMKRVPEVLDVWFDSGVSSWAALNSEERKKFWPADLNIEGKDQVRGWWNSQFILSEIKFDKKPFDSISVHGMVLDLGKKKMSKSLGNIVSPHDIIEKYGRDYMRYYFAKTSKGEDFSFDENDFKDIGNFFRVFVNINNFTNQLDIRNAPKFCISEHPKILKKSEQEFFEKKKGKLKAEDKWILSRLNSTIDEITKSYNSYRFPEAIASLEKFMIEDLSKTYIQIIRERSDEIYPVMEEIRVSILKLLAPVCPLITEKIWQNLLKENVVKEESIHLSEFPKAEKIEEKLEKEFYYALKIIESGLFERDKAKIGLKWPLANAKIKFSEKISKELEEIIARQLNVKNIEIDFGEKLSVELDLNMTEELEAEGFARELARTIQSERKKAGLVKTDEIELEIICDLEMERVLKIHEKFLKERVNAKVLSFKKGKKEMKNSIKTRIKERDFEVKFSKI